MAPPGQRDLTVLLQKLEAGDDPGSAALVALSHLDRAEAAEVRAAWERFPLAIRGVVIGRATALAEDNVELNFEELARIGLKDQDAGVRALAIEGLWESEDREVAREFMALLRDDPSDEVRTCAAKRLRPFVHQREMGDFDESLGDDLVEVLARVAANEGEPVELQATALESLGARGLPGVRGLIESAYYSDDRRLKLAALRAMADSAEERWLEFVLDQVVSDDPEFRFEGAVALGEIGAEEGIEPLAELLKDDDSDVVLAAVQALGEIGGEEALHYLNELRRRVPEGMEEAVDEAIESARPGLGDLFRQGLATK